MRFESVAARHKDVRDGSDGGGGQGGDGGGDRSLWLRASSGC